MQQFWYQSRGYYYRKEYEYALVSHSSKRTLVTTSAFAKDFDYLWNEKNKDTEVEEAYDDFVSLQLIGQKFRQLGAIIPKQLTKNEYSVISLKGKKAVRVGLGRNWRQVWTKFNNDYRKKKVEAVLVYPNGRVYYYSGARNRWAMYWGGLEAIARFIQQNKLDLAPGWDEKSHGIKTLKQWKAELAERTKFIDNFKTNFSGDRLRRNTPFWIHYMWTGGRHAGRQGQLRYFATTSMKYAFNVFRNDVRRYLRAGHKIAFTLSVSHYPNRQTIMASEPMDSPHIQSMLGWF